MTAQTATLTAPEQRETPDFERIDKLIAWAEGEYEKKLAGKPSEWDQGDWVHELYGNGEDWDNLCGTACCIAGRVGLEDKVLRTFSFDGLSGEGVLDSTIFVNDETHEQRGEYLHVSRYARRVLGIDRHDYTVGDLFEGSNTLGDLKEIRDNMAEANGVVRRWTEDDYAQGHEGDL